jgi:hypothetical protein
LLRCKRIGDRLRHVAEVLKTCYKPCVLIAEVMLIWS